MKPSFLDVHVQGPKILEKLPMELIFESVCLFFNPFVGLSGVKSQEIRKARIWADEGTFSIYLGNPSLAKIQAKTLGKKKSVEEH